MKKLLLLLLCAPSALYPAPYIQRSDFINNILGEYLDGGKTKPLTEEALRARYQWSPANPINPAKLANIRKISVDAWLTAWYKNNNHRRAAIFQGKFHSSNATVNTAGYPNLPILTGLSAKELEKQVGDKKFAGKPSFTIIFYDPLQPQFGDIRYLQTLPELKGATFQIASTFNCLEGGMGDDLTNPRTQTVKNETTILRTGGPNLTDMLGAAVQGEEAAIACAGATLFRKYFMPPVNLLHRLPGIVMKEEKGFDLPTLGTLIGIGNGTINANINSDDVAVGLHQNVVVTSGYGSGKTQVEMPVFLDATGNAVDTEKTQIVNQVFTSACSLINIRKDPKWPTYADNLSTFCKHILKGSYDGTLRAAALTDSPTVVLTLMGGGAFRNDIAWINNAIRGSENLIRDHNLQIVLVYRPDKIRPAPVVRTVAGDIDFLKSMRDFNEIIHNTDFADKKTFDENIKQYVTASYQITTLLDEINKLQKSSKPADIAQIPQKVTEHEQAIQTASQYAKLLQKDFLHPIFNTTKPVLPPADKPIDKPVDKPVSDDKDLITALNNLTTALSSVVGSLTK